MKKESNFLFVYFDNFVIRNGGSPSFCNFGCGNFILLKLLLLTSKKIKGITTILVHPFRLEESW